MTILKTAAGGAIIAAGSGLAAISGLLAYHGFEALIPIPFAGWIGPLTAAACIALGIAVESELRAKRWIGAAVLGLLLAGAGLLDRHSGEMALLEQVRAAEQANADRLQAFRVAQQAVTDATAIITDREAKLGVLMGADVVAAQRVLGVIPDGRWGTDTAAAATSIAAVFRAEIETAREAVREHTPTVAAGLPVAEQAFNHADAAMYASVITLLSIVLAFAGAYVANTGRRTPEEELVAVEEAVDELEAEVFDLAAFLQARENRAA